MDVLGVYVTPDLSYSWKKYCFIWKDLNDKEGIFNVIGIDNVPNHLKWAELPDLKVSKPTCIIIPDEIEIKKKYIIVCGLTKSLFSYDCDDENAIKHYFEKVPGTKLLSEY